MKTCRRERESRNVEPFGVPYPVFVSIRVIPRGPRHRPRLRFPVRRFARNVVPPSPPFLYTFINLGGHVRSAGYLDNKEN